MVDQQYLESIVGSRRLALRAQSGGNKGSVGHPYRRAVLAREPRHATNMVTVLVRHDDGIEVRRFQAKARQTPLCITQAETAIEHDARDGIAVRCLDNQGVSFAARSE